MRTTHYKLLMIGGKAWERLKVELPKMPWSDELGYGFILRADNTANRVRGTLVYRRMQNVKDLDVENMTPKDQAVQAHAEVRFELDFQKALVSVEGPRGGLAVLYEHIDSIPFCQVAFEDLDLNLRDLLFEVQGAYRKNMVKSLRIRNYLAREHMLATAGFKIVEASEAEKIAEKFSDQLEAFTLSLKLPDGACKLTVTRRGSVSASDDAPDELLLFVKDLLPRFDEPEVETAEVVDPVGAVEKALDNMADLAEREGVQFSMQVGDGPEVEIKKRPTQAFKDWEAGGGAKGKLKKGRAFRA